MIAKLKKRNRKGGIKPKTKTKGKTHKISQLVNLTKGTIKAIATAIRDDADGAETDESDSDEEIPMKPPAKKAKSGNNRSNPALNRG